MASKLIAIRLRGRVNVTEKVKKTLNLLRLHKANHAVLIENNPSYLGMLQHAKDHITWGPIDATTLTRLLQKRGRLKRVEGAGGPNQDRLTDTYVKNNTKFKTIKQFADSLLTGAVELAEIPNLKPVFRLHPPKGGFKQSIKRPFKDKGELGNRGEAINNLVSIMT